MVKRNKPLSDKQRAHYDRLRTESDAILQEWLQVQLAKAPPLTAERLEAIAEAFNKKR